MDRRIKMALLTSLVAVAAPNTVEHEILGGNAYPNRFTHAPEFPNATFRQVIRPNGDTLYSLAWLDVAREPMLLEVPDTKGRFYLVQLMDA